MNVFLTGGSGFVGSGVVRELLAAGHQIRGLARSDDSVAKIASAGVTPVRGDLTDLALLHDESTNADAVVHCGFSHDFSKHMEAIEMDRRAVDTIVDGLIESRGPRVFICTGGIAAARVEDRPVLETDLADASVTPRGLTEQIVRDAVKRGVRSAVLRLPPSVHGPETHGFIPMLFSLAKQSGVSAYAGDGSNRWPAVHRDDAAVLYRLAIDALADGRVPAGSALHAVHDTGVPTRDVAQAVADALKLGPPESRPAEHFGWLGRFAAIDVPASADLTRRWTGWTPTRIGLLDDIRSEAYAPLR